MSKYNIVYDKDRIAEAKERRIAWREGRKSDRIPLLFTVSNPPNLYNYIERINDNDKAIEHFVANTQYQLDNFPEGDILPYYDLVYLGEGLIPSMFGAVQHVVENLPPFTEGRLMKNLEKDLPKLKKQVDPEHDGWGPKLKDLIEKFFSMTNGDFPMANVDVQSPYGVATKLISNEELMIAMYETPELVHELFEITTQAIIDVTNAVIKWAGGGERVALNYVDPLPSAGIEFYDDYISVINPSLSKKFCENYNKRLFELFGYGHLHTCGPYFPNFIDAVLDCEPVSIDINCMRGNLQKTREDMLQLKKLAKQHNVRLHGELTAFPISQFDTSNHIPVDEHFLRQMAGDGMMLWCANGTREQGLEYLKMAEECLDR